METELAPLAPIQTEIAPTQSVAPPSSASSDVFENMSNQKPMDLKSLLLFGLLVAFSIYGITYYRKAISKLNEDKKPNEEFLNVVDDVEELKYNLKKALGKKYHTT